MSILERLAYLEQASQYTLTEIQRLKAELKRQKDSYQQIAGALTVCREIANEQAPQPSAPPSQPVLPPQPVAPPPAD